MMFCVYMLYISNDGMRPFFPCFSGCHGVLYVKNMDVQIFWNDYIFQVVNCTWMNTRLVKKYSIRHPHRNTIGTKHRPLGSAAGYRAQGSILYWLYNNCLHVLDSLHSKNMAVCSWCFIYAFNGEITYMNTRMWTSFYSNLKNGCSQWHSYFDSVLEMATYLCTLSDGVFIDLQPVASAASVY